MAAAVKLFRGDVEGQIVLPGFNPIRSRENARTDPTAANADFLDATLPYRNTTASLQLRAANAATASASECTIGNKFSSPEVTSTSLTN